MQGRKVRSFASELGFVILALASARLAAASAAETRFVPIPRSALHVEIPVAWTDHLAYLIDGPKTLNVNLPEDEHGAMPMFPQFEFELIAEAASLEAYVGKRAEPDGDSVQWTSGAIPGRRSAIRSQRSEVTFDGVDQRGNQAAWRENMSVVEIVLEVDQQLVACRLRALGKETIERYRPELLRFCASIADPRPTR